MLSKNVKTPQKAFHHYIRNPLRESRPPLVNTMERNGEHVQARGVAAAHRRFGGRFGGLASKSALDSLDRGLLIRFNDYAISKIG